MDLLQNVLNISGLKSKSLGLRKIAGSTTLQFPCNRSIGFHIVIQGAAFLHLNGKSKPIELSTGDIAFAARGQDHYLSTDHKINSKFVSLGEFTKKNHSTTKPRLTLISGAYQVWNDPIHPLFFELPDFFVLKATELQSFDQLHTMIAFLAKESQLDEYGSDQIVQSLLDILFSLIFRKVLKKTSSNPETWSHALLDENIKKSVTLMHTHLDKAWTLDTLAKDIGMSRAGFALKFKKSMGDTPLHYLTIVRVQKAMELLRTTTDNIDTIASAVGYNDAFGFSKVFKKTTGIPPKEFRKINHADQQTPWHF